MKNTISNLFQEITSPDYKGKDYLFSTTDVIKDTVKPTPEEYSKMTLFQRLRVKSPNVKCEFTLNHNH